MDYSRMIAETRAEIENLTRLVEKHREASRVPGVSREDWKRECREVITFSTIRWEQRAVLKKLEALERGDYLVFL